MYEPILRDINPPQNMKPLFAVLALSALCASTGALTRGHAAETKPAIESPNAKPLGLPMQGKPGHGTLSCTFEEESNAELHVLLCRFEHAESCPLKNPVPLRILMLRFDAVRIIGIGSTAEGCSRVTFTGSLKAD